MRVLAYLRVSTSEQADSRAGLEAQRTAILAEAKRRGWTEVAFIEDAGWSAKDMKRPGLHRALAMLKGREADALVVSKMDRLSRSLLDFAAIMQRAQKEGWALLALDSPADLTTPTGEAMAGVLAVFAQLERRLIAERTRTALAQRKAAGVRLGRARAISPEVEARVRELRAEGFSVRGIAAQLAVEGHRAPGGSEWQPSTLQRVLTRKGS
jgi:DNA invertase Pin-like site-specific DNA recombinase